MTNENILNKTLEAFRGIKEYSSSGRVPKPCYAVIHIDGTTKLFHTNTSRQHKFIYNNPGALKNSIRNWLEYNVYDIIINQWGREERDWLTSAQVDMIMNYLFDNNIIEIVYVYETS